MMALFNLPILEFVVVCTLFFLVFVLLMIIFLIFMTTYAGAELKARFFNLPLYITDYGNGLQSMHCAIKKAQKYFMQAKDSMGKKTPTIEINGTGRIDKKLKTSVYHVYEGMASTFDKDFPHIQEKFKEKGIAFQNYSDYRMVVECLSNDNLFEKHLDENIEPEYKEGFKKAIEELREEGINIEPGKSINSENLINMWPHNIDTAVVDSMIEDQKNLQKRQERSMENAIKWIFVGGIVLFLLMIGASFLFDSFGEDTCTCSCVGAPEQQGNNTPNPTVQKVPKEREQIPGSQFMPDAMEI